MTTLAVATGNAIIDSSAAVHPTALVGDGARVVGQVTVGPEARIGSGCTVEGSAERPTIIGAGARIGDFARIYPGARLGDGCQVGAFAVIGLSLDAGDAGKTRSRFADILALLTVREAGTLIGPGASIGTHCIISSHVAIGSNCDVRDFTLVRGHTRIGSRCELNARVNVNGYAVIGDRANLGEGVELNPLTVVGKNVTIGSYTVLGDKAGRSGSFGGRLAAIFVEDCVRIGQSCKVMPAVVIEKAAQIEADSTVAASIPPHALASGAPAQVMRLLTHDELRQFRQDV